MNETQRLAIGLILTFMLLLSSVFVFHASPQFPGSLAGSLLGIAAAILMVSLLIYPVAKYVVPPGARPVSMRALLTFHVYAGAVGALLGILHTGHKYQSPLGIALVVTMLVVVATGFVGRYYLPQVSAELAEQRSRLATLRSAYNRIAAAADVDPLPAGAMAPRTPQALPGISILQLVDGIADLEHAIGFRDAAKSIFVRWIVAHAVSAILMYLFLGLHVVGEVYYGLRWLP